MEDAWHNEVIFFVIEGTDGSGKGTQFALLAERLEKAGYDIATFDFPRYDQESSYFVRQYLNGKYGGAEDVGPYTSSLFYALDRYEAAPQIRQALEDGKIVLANRYAGSSMAHQGTKFANPEQRRGFFIWLDNLEFQMLGIPRPDASIVLRVPADIAQGLVDKKEKRSYTDKKRDIHEADINHLRLSVEVYDDLCKLFPKDFTRIDCVRNERLLFIDEVQTLLWEKISPLLPKPSKHKRKDTKTKDAGVKQNAPSQKSGYVTHTSLRSNITMTAAEATGMLFVPHASQQLAERDANGQFSYYIPQRLDATTKNLYCEIVDQLFEKYAVIRETLLESASTSSETVAAERMAQLVLPLATTQTAIWTGATEPLVRLLGTLLTSEDVEQRGIAQDLLAHVSADDEAVLSEVNSLVASLAKKTPRSKLEKLVTETLDGGHTLDTATGVGLVQVSPRNELDTVTALAYKFSDAALSSIQLEASNWTYEQKSSILLAAVADNNLPNALYGFDVVSSIAEITELAQSNICNSMSYQTVSPRLGFEVPGMVEEAGLVEEFEECFELSLQLHSKLQMAGFIAESDYAVLLGHKVRCLIDSPASKLRNITNPTALQATLIEQAAQKHPLLFAD